MQMPLSGQAAELVGTSDLVIIVERVDDVALLIGQMAKMGLPEVLDRHIPRHWKQRGLSWGWTAVIWLAYILTEGDHRKVAVETSIVGMRHTLSQLTAQVIAPLDFRDDRLSHLLTHLSKPKSWRPIERDLNAQSIKTWTERVVVVRSPAHATQQAAGLATRLAHAEQKRGGNLLAYMIKRQFRPLFNGDLC